MSKQDQKKEIKIDPLYNGNYNPFMLLSSNQFEVIVEGQNLLF